MCASWSEISALASSISSTTLLASMACKVLITENFSTASNTLPRLRRPAVSISVYDRPPRSNSISIASRVVPG
ncbi:Uncharacterised protein [Mycobacteroides abscessus subsp. abscessus]|nr:Uncharacterised protein [Mycobacteroides abscessus subsp. abscessus]